MSGAITVETIAELPPAVAPQVTDLLMTWQPGQTPHTRRITLADAVVTGIRGGGATVYVQDAPPGGVPDNTLWWDSVGTQLYVLYNDGNSSQWVAASSLSSAFGGIYYTDQYPSIQAAHDALPAGGGELVLPPNTTSILAATLNISKPNVILRGHGWSSMLQRNASLNAPLVNVTGDNCLICDLAIDGNGVANTANLFAELQLNGQFCTGERLRVSNSRAVHVAIQGAYSALRRSRIAGLNDVTGTIQSYGVWAINHVTTFVRDNVVTDCGIDGIGVDGNGTQVIGNYLANNHSYTGIGGGQIATYGANANSVGILIANNTIDAGAGPTSHGIEVDSYGVTISGNVIRNQKWNGIAFDAGAGISATITGNTIMNCGQSQPGGNAAIMLAAANSNFVITGNTLVDTQGTPTQQWAVQIPAGASNNYIIRNNLMRGNTAGKISDSGTGFNKDIIGPELLYQTTTIVGSGADLTMDQLQTFTVPANTLNSTGDRLFIKAGGGFAGNTNSKSAALFWAGTQIGIITVSAVGQQVWRLEAEIMLVSSGVQAWSGTFSTNANTVASFVANAGARGNTAPQPVAIFGQNTTAATANSVTCSYFTVDFVPVASV